MLAAWQPLLDAMGARLVDGSAHFPGAPADMESLAQGSLLVPLPDYRLLALAGPDGAGFLQGQLTCDVNAVTETLSSPAAHCTPKGRMLTSFQLARRGAALFWLRLRADLADGTARQLGKYLVFSKAKLRPLDEQLVVGLYGAQAAAALREAYGTLPSGRYGTANLDDGLLLQLDDAGLQFECWLPPERALALWQQCRGRFAPAGGDFWRWLRIRAGRAELCAATAEQFIPQMLNYHLLGAVSFSKGCYTGQEIVARAHYRGQVKRHLLRAEIDGQPPAPGAELRDARGRAAGQVVEAVASAAGRAELLAVSGAESGEPLQTAEGLTLRVLPLPYAIT
jgi:folate-binding protein YgfZ